MAAGSNAGAGLADPSITPRRAPKPAPEEARTSIRIESNLVLIPVSVIDSKDRLVTGLGPEAFRVYECKTEQTVAHFAEEDVPVSVGIVFDSSGSMRNKLREAKQALAEFAKTANPEDEFFLMRFDSRPELLAPFTHGLSAAQNLLLATKAAGKTALLDAVYMALDYMRNAKNSRKALLVISDGGDNHSRYTREEIRQVLRESGTAIYAMGLYAGPPRILPEEVWAGPGLLNEMADESGGRQFEIRTPSDLPEAAGLLGRELHNQYVLGVHPNGCTPDGRYHRIQVRVVAGRNLRVFARPGYYGAER